MIRKIDLAKCIQKEFNIPIATCIKIIDYAIHIMKIELNRWSDVIFNKFLTLSVKDTMWRTVVVPSTGKLSPKKIYKRLKCKFSAWFRREIKQS